MSEAQPQQNQQVQKEGTHDAIYIGKKPLMAYVTSTLIQLANQPSVTIKARGLSIGRAVDVSQIILKRMENAGYKIGDVRIGSETVQSEDGRTRNVSTIEIEVKRSSWGLSDTFCYLYIRCFWFKNWEDTLPSISDTWIHWQRLIRMSSRFYKRIIMYMFSL